MNHDPPATTEWNRRRTLKALSIVGLGALFGCGGDSSPATTASATTEPAISAAATPPTAGATSASPTTAVATATAVPPDVEGIGCPAVIPEEMAGPYPGDGTNGPNALADDTVVRSDITSSFETATGVADGIPMSIVVDLVDTTSGCAPLSGAAVYVWHCDRDGRYSMYSEGATTENYLRGVQPADSNGRVTFQSVFPGCYPGRWPHIHFEIYESVDAALAAGNRYATSQIAIPKGACDAAFATAGYEASAANLAELSLASDIVFGDDGAINQLGTVIGDVNAGYTVALTVGVDPTVRSTGAAGGGPREPGDRQPPP